MQNYVILEKSAGEQVFLAAGQCILMGEVLNYLENMYPSHEVLELKNLVPNYFYNCKNDKNSLLQIFQFLQLHAIGICFPSNLVPLPSKSIEQLPRKLAHTLIFLK